MRSSYQNIKVLLNVFIGLSLILPGFTSHGMTLDEYLFEVRRESLSYKSDDEKSEGLEMQLGEADLYFVPKFFIDASYMDTSLPQNPAFYKGLEVKTLAAGISQDFRFGLEAKLSYQATGSTMTGTPAPNPMFSILTDYWDVSPFLELKMPLWSGGFGRNIRATEESLRKQVVAEQYKSEAQARELLANAEANYWKLSIWKEVVQIQEQALKAAKNILSHVSKKKKMNLGEESDVVQAEALVESKQLELKIANDEYRSALRAFNKFLNRDAYRTVDVLDKVNYINMESFEIPTKRPGNRADIKALQAQADWAAAQAKLAKERGLPKLDISGKFNLEGRDQSFSTSTENAINNQFNTTSIGLNFSVPLYFGKLSDLEKGAIKVQQAAELSKEAAMFNQEQAWIQLVETLKDVRENLKMLTNLEAIQKNKLEVERVRFKQGRTTVFQVLMFEQDYSQASVSRAKLASDILGLISQIKLYNAEEGKSL